MQAEASPETIVFFGNRFVPLAEAKVGILTHALHYGTGVFEGIRGYWDGAANDLYMVRPFDHFLRWKANGGILRLQVPLTVSELTSLAAELVRRNGYRTNIYIRPLAYKSAQRIGVAPDDQDSFALIAVPYGDYLDSSRGLHAGVVSWRRIEDNAIPGRAKICGAYVNSALAGDEARRNGFDEAIFLTESGHVAEGASCNLFIVRRGVLVTPPPSDNILEGITRASVMELARREMHLEVIERSIDRSELYIADEAFFTGTAVEVGPITAVDHRPIGSGLIGPVSRELRHLYLEATHGHLPRYRHWLLAIYQPFHLGRVA
ncbi:MAG: branched-chain amino acid transaminase [Bryobacteraceae bacterium]